MGWETPVDDEPLMQGKTWEERTGVLSAAVVQALREVERHAVSSLHGSDSCAGLVHSLLEEASAAGAREAAIAELYAQMEAGETVTVPTPLGHVWRPESAEDTEQSEFPALSLSAAGEVSHQADGSPDHRGVEGGDTAAPPSVQPGPTSATDGQAIAVTDAPVGTLSGQADSSAETAVAPVSTATPE